MHRVASALAAVHESGVLHNDVTADHFILEPEAEGGAGPAPPAKIIGFGYAAPISMQEMDDDREFVNDDLYSLGVIYRDLLKAGFGARRKGGGGGRRRPATRYSMKRTSITNLTGSADPRPAGDGRVVDGAMVRRSMAPPSS